MISQKGIQMKIFKGLFLLLSLVCLLGTAGAMAAKTEVITFNSLLEEMVNLDKLAEFPQPYFTCKQFSSYDRRSHNKEDLSDAGWFGNADACQILRTEKVNGKDEFVLMDVEGPGTIVRIWSANAADAGIVKIYLDNSETPVIEMPLGDMMNGENEPFVKPISGIRAKGWNCYMPIPYAKHCKVTIEKNAIYYQINYRTYNKDTKIKTFTLDDAKKNIDKIKKTAELLANPQQIISCKNPKTKNYDLTIEPGKTKTVEVNMKNSAIYNFTCKLDSEDIKQAARQTVLEINFDGQDKANVASPVGDFFGSAPGINPFASLPLEVSQDGVMTNRWVMPFKNKAVLKFTNYSDTTVKLTGVVATAVRRWTKETMYFNAKWKAEYGMNVRPRFDWNYVKCKGKGRYVGNMLLVSNPVTSWWGEGDEKIYVDGEDFPSTFGTGTEDYYGYAWCSNDIFEHAYHNQSRCDGPDNYGHTSNSRFHFLDSIPFESSLNFDMEVWTHASGFTVDYAQISYWYEKEETTDNFEDITKEKLIVPTLPKSQKMEGVIEAEDMQKKVMGGVAFAQKNFVWYYSNDQAIWWLENKPGDTLELTFNAEKAGRYNVKGKFTQGFSLGIHELFINNQSAGSRDWWGPDFKAADSEETIGVFDLKQGENVLKVICKKKNPKSFGTIFTLDYIRLIAID